VRASALAQRPAGEETDFVDVETELTELLRKAQ
jgi:hypothetical protein